jgi:multidrug efflux pump subunit AcrA (membrane-fusion protein)
VFIVQPFGREATATEYMTETVSRGNIEKTISSSATLAAGTTREVSASVGGTVSSVYVKVGDSVNKGDLLFSVADDDLNSSVSTAASQLSAAQQQLKAARAGLTSAQATHVQTEKEILADLVKSGSSGAISGGSGSSSGGSGAAGMSTSASTSSGDVGTKSATSISTLATSGTSSTKATAAQKKAAKAQAAQAKANKVRAVASAQAEIQSANQSVASAQTAYNEAVDALGNAKVTSPIDGVITAVNIAKGDVVTGSSSSSSSGGSSGSGGGSTGDSATSAAAAAAAAGADSSSSSATSNIEIVNFNKRMTLTVDVSESEINSLKLGMKAVLTFDAIEALEQEGKISEISPLGTTSGGLVTYPVTIDISKPAAQLKPGMNASAKVILESVSDVLMVPNTAISGNANRGYTVQVAAGGDTSKLETRTVTLGMANDSYTEVSSGLSEGEVVLTGTIDTSADSSSGNVMMGGGMRTEVETGGESGSAPSGAPPGAGGSFTNSARGQSSGSAQGQP